MELPDKTPPQTGKYLNRRLYFNKYLLAYHLLIFKDREWVPVSNLRKLMRFYK